MKFVVYKDEAGEWRWQLVARNQKLVACSGEGYKEKRSALRIVDRINGGGHEVIDTES